MEIPMIIEKKKLSELKPAPYNPRQSTAKQEKHLKASLEKFGVVEPIIYNKQTGYIVGGHFRVRELKKLGYKEIECVIVDLNQENERELNIRLNANTGEWDWDMLANEWDAESLEDWGLDLPFETDTHLEAEEDDFEIPEEVKTDIVLGDLFEIGEHRLLCGDSTDSDHVAKLMNGQKADMVFTDPPYNVDYGNIKHPKFKQRAIENDNMSEDEFKNFCQGFISNIVLFCDGIVYCWAGPGKDGRIMFTVLDENLHNSTMIVWNKDQFTLGRGKYQNKHEVCWFGWNKSGASFTEDRTLTNVWDFDRPKKSELHPTMKPIQIVENGLNHSSKKGDIILDLFGGSGSTMVGCNQLQRKGYLMELDPKYCQVIVDRMKKLDPTIKIKKNGVELK
jgi:DNA modification methylase